MPCSKLSEAGSITGTTGQTVTVECIEGGYTGGGDVTCQTDSTFTTALCLFTAGSSIQGAWAYPDESTATVGPVQFVSISVARMWQQQLKAGTLQASDLVVQSDLDMYIQRDDSYSPSSLTYLRLDTNEIETYLFTGGYANHCNLKVIDAGKTLVCSGDMCRTLTPGTGYPIVLISAFMSPKENAVAHLDGWRRNQWTLTATHYRAGFPAYRPPSAPAELTCSGYGSGQNLGSYIDVVDWPRIRTEEYWLKADAASMAKARSIVAIFTNSGGADVAGLSLRENLN